MGVRVQISTPDNKPDAPYMSVTPAAMGVLLWTIQGNTSPKFNKKPRLKEIWWGEDTCYLLLGLQSMHKYAWVYTRARTRTHAHTYTHKH